ncbi:MAG: hypothetical protein A2096_02395, partial [Spirochaetes bacterium GWF1_41_5]
TCTVTGKADRKSRAALLAACRGSRVRMVAGIGCYTELIKANDFNPGINYFSIPQNKKSQACSLILDRLGIKDVWNEKKIEGMVSEHTRAFIKIQDGCREFCSYCRIPYARGMPASKPAEKILAEFSSLTANKVPEIVLSGINIGAYNDRGLELAGLINKILNIDGPLLRISSIEPCHLTQQLIEIFPHPRLCRHLHIPLQSGSDRILSEMGRKYDSQFIHSLCGNIYKRCPEMALSTDIITGYPGETENDFESGLKLLTDCGFMRLHAFPYSARPGTAAAEKKDNISSDCKKERVADLMSLSGRLLSAYCRRQKKMRCRLVVEKTVKDSPDNYCEGTTDNYLKGRLKARAQKGEVLDVILTGEQSGNCVFELAFRTD